MLYDSEYWVVDSRTEQSMSVAEMRILKLASGVTREGRIRNEYVIGSIGVWSVTNS
jgi:hypothetical protein